MKTSDRLLTALVASLAVGAAVGVFSGCTEEPPPSVYDENYVSRPQPVVTSITPAGSGLAGVTTITLAGSNFSAVPGENTVFFDAVPATILQASTTEIRVIAPVLVKDSIKVRVAVFRAELFSEIRYYRLDAAVEPFGGLSQNDEPAAIASDTAGNIYVSLLSGGTGVGIKKFTPEGVRSDYAPAGGITKWTTLKMGPGGVLYAARLLRVIYTIPAGGGAPAIWLAPASGVGNVADMDFDQNGNLWAGGNNAAVYRVKPDKTIKSFPFTANIRAVRVIENYLYVGGKRDSLEKVWRFPILSADSLGPVEEYYNLSSYYTPNGPGVQSINFAADGDLYIGTDGADGIIVVHPSKAAEPLYPGLFTPSMVSLAWGKGNFQYGSRSVNSPALLKINMLKPGAPYYGSRL